MRCSAAILVALICSVGACRPAADDGRESTASVDQGPIDAGALFQRKCGSCHGALGRGDGPAGAIRGASDLTNPELQDGLADEDIARTIREGTGRMDPIFGLDDAEIDALVQYVRTLSTSSR